MAVCVYTVLDWEYDASYVGSVPETVYVVALPDAVDVEDTVAVPVWDESLEHTNPTVQVLQSELQAYVLAEYECPNADIDRELHVVAVLDEVKYVPHLEQ